MKEAINPQEFEQWLQQQGIRKVVTYYVPLGTDGDGNPQGEYKSLHELEDIYQFEKMRIVNRKKK